MNVKNLITAAAILSSVVPGLALADGFRVHAGFSLPNVDVHVHGAGCNHGAEPVPVVVNTNPYPPPQQQQQASGHYELRTVSELVPGSYQQVWVPGSCQVRYGRWGHAHQFCTAGYYTQQFVPARYVDVHKYVWVADQPAYQYGSYQPGYDRDDDDDSYGGYGAQR